jgi:hypothetical protein
MRARSWMAALALVGGASIVMERGLSAKAPRPTQEQGQTPDQTKPARPAARITAPKPADSRIPLVHLNLAIAGLGRDGCELEVKPANAGCKFRPVYLNKGPDGVFHVVSAPQHVPADGRTELDLRDVELRGADHTCTVAITVREPGQPPRTVYRGFRLTGRAGNPPSASAVPSFTCYLSSRVVTVEGTRTRK